jgi:hypothetical protein
VSSALIDFSNSTIFSEYLRGFTAGFKREMTFVVGFFDVIAYALGRLSD